MAVEAARDCLDGERPSGIESVQMASTSFPFDDRQNASIAATALNLPEEISTMDVGGSQRAATTALIKILTGLGGSSGSTLL
ncbi:MAG: 3-hydroxy-3-methylglutaryl CoA synthase, partial [Pseudomonadota bacterium]